MALLTSELQRLRFETGYNLLGIGAEPYIAYLQVFNNVIVPYLNAGAKTTSSTVVVASNPPSPVAITLAGPASFVAGDAIVIDVDAQQERATIESITGSAATVYLALAHVGTYPVTQEGGESIIREILGTLYQIAVRLKKAANTAGVKQLDKGDVIFENAKGMSTIDTLIALRLYWRRELASALGIPLLWDVRSGAGGGGGAVELY